MQYYNHLHLIFFKSVHWNDTVMAGVGSSGGHTGTRTINVEGGLLVLTSQICDLQSQLYIKIAYIEVSLQFLVNILCAAWLAVGIKKASLLFCHVNNTQQDSPVRC